MDEAAIAAALVARFEGLTPPSGEQTIAFLSSELPAQVGATPALLVDPNPEDAYEWYPSLSRRGLSTWRLLFLRAQEGDYGPRMNALSAWRPVLRDRIVGRIQLGLAYVHWAELRGMSPAREITYAEVAYDGLELTVVVQTHEQVAAAA